MNDGIIYKRLIRYALPDRGLLVLAVLGYALYSAVDAAFTYLVQPLLNKGFVLKEPHFLHTLPWIIIGLFLIRGLTNLMANTCMTWVSRSSVNRIRSELFQHFLKLPYEFYDRHHSGKLLSLMLYNSDQLSAMYSDLSTSFIQSGSLVIGLLVVMLMTQWKLTLLLMLLIPLMTVLMRAVSVRLKKLNSRIQNTMGVLAQRVEETLNAVSIIRIYGAQSRETEKMDAILKSHRRHETHIALTHSGGVVCMQVLAASMLSLTLLLAAHPQSMFALSAGEFVSMMAAMLAMLKPLRDLSKINAILQKGLASATAIFECLDSPIESEPAAPSQHLPARTQGNITVQNVSFTYAGRERPALQAIDCHLPAGKTIAIVGGSGSGKTTFTQLLLGFYRPQTGKILLDGIDCAQVSLEALRSQYAVVSQHTVLFHASIAENIAYGTANGVASFEDLRAAAEAAHALDFIEQLPQGWDTTVGDNGFSLSGGQRQRIALARALLKNAPIVILDEATSALDLHSERAVQKALENDQKKHARTYLVIAHRLATIQKADWILVLDQGRLIQQGTPSELLQQEGLYARINALMEDETPA